MVRGTGLSRTAPGAGTEAEGRGTGGGAGVVGFGFRCHQGAFTPHKQLHYWATSTDLGPGEVHMG